MNLLLLNYEFPPLGGGAGNATKHIARELVLLGHEVTVVTAWFPGVSKEEHDEGYTLIRVPSLRKRKDASNIVEMLHYVFCAIRTCKRLTKRTVFDCSISFFALPTGLVSYWLYRRNGIPYILSLRGGDVPGFLAMSLRWHHRFSAPLTGIVWRHAKQIIANSRDLQSLANRTARLYNTEVGYIPNGVDTDCYHPPEGVRMDSGIHFLFVGRLVEQKGVSRLLHALGVMQQTEAVLLTGVTVTIAGDGPLRTSLESQATLLGIEHFVRFIGWVSREDLPKLYQEHEVLVLPSYEEGMPNVVLEAMASGLAVIAARIGGVDELVEHERNGLLFESDQELEQVLRRCIKDKGLIGMFSSVSRAVAETWSWKLVAEQYAQLCQESVRS